MSDKIDLKLIELDRKLKQAQAELDNPNSTDGTYRKAHVEIVSIKYAIITLNELKK